MERFVKVMEKGDPETLLNLPIDDQYCLSKQILERDFTGARSLKYKRMSSDEWFTVGILNENLFIGKDNFEQNYVYVVHRPLVTTTTHAQQQTDTPPISAERQTDTPPISARRRIRDYLKIFIDNWVFNDTNWYKKLQ